MATTAINGIVEIENVWIIMSDGCRIAARIWLPADADRAFAPDWYIAEGSLSQPPLAD